MLNDLNDQEEYSDLVDENDKVIGRMSTMEARRQGLKNLRVINAFIINSKGELWIPRRQVDKEFFPSCLDMSIGGHVSSGETYEEALKREAREELNIDIEKIRIRLLGSLGPEDGVHFMKVYEIKSDEAPDYNKEDFCDFFWLKPNDLIEKIKLGDKSKKELPFCFSISEVMALMRFNPL